MEQKEAEHFIDDIIYQFLKGYNVPIKNVKYCIELCLEYEEYESMSQLMREYELVYGKGTFKQIVK